MPTAGEVVTSTSHLADIRARYYISCPLNTLIAAFNLLLNERLSVTALSLPIASSSSLV
jgi:hypothetical protein